jgi:hypothetical protein
MKRASLSSAKVPVISSTSLDVTDRLLKTDEDKIAPTKPRPSPASKRSPRAARPAPPNAPVVVAPVPKPDPVSLALAQTELALTALRKARIESPAQYDVAVRYRLDALAHHLQQVSDFITRQNA